METQSHKEGRQTQCCLGLIRTLNEGLGVPLLNMLVPRCIVPARSEPTAFGAEIPPEAVEKWRTRLQKVTVNLEHHVLMRCTRSQEWGCKCVFMVTGAQTGEGVTCSMITGANVAVTAWVAAGRTGARIMYISGARIMYISSSAMATLSVTGEGRLCGEISATSCASAEIHGSGAHLWSSRSSKKSLHITTSMCRAVEYVVVRQSSHQEVVVTVFVASFL